MLGPTIENRSFFSFRISKFCGGDRAEAERVPAAALVGAVKEIHSEEDAVRFLSGMVHWLRGRRPRAYEEILVIAKANLSYCFSEGLPKADILLWQRVWEEHVEGAESVPASQQSPEEAFKRASAVGEQLKAGRDPGLAAALAKKALQKKSETAGEAK